MKRLWVVLALAVPLTTAQAGERPAPTPEPARAASTRPSAERRVDLNLKDADLHNLMRLFSEVGQVNILIPEDIRGTVTVRLNNVPWTRAMQVILKSRGLGHVREDNVIRVATAANLLKEAEEEVRRLELGGPARVSRRLTLRHTDIGDVSAGISARMSGRGRLLVDPSGTRLFLVDDPDAVERVSAFIHQADCPAP